MMAILSSLALPVIPAGLRALFVSPFARALAIVLAALALVWIIYAKGQSAAESKCDAASVRAELRIVQADLRKAQNAAADALVKADEISTNESNLKEKQHELESALAKRPPAGACVITPDDARRLR